MVDSLTRLPYTELLCLISIYHFVANSPFLVPAPSTTGPLFLSGGDFNRKLWEIHSGGDWQETSVLEKVKLVSEQHNYNSGGNYEISISKSMRHNYHLEIIAKQLLYTINIHIYTCTHEIKIEKTEENKLILYLK
ncbi:hypothetical protein ANTPLA_LOCUS594 [Anthophora plagiata]